MFVFRDRVPIAAGTGCEARADGSVACEARVTRADLGDGDDSARSATLRSWFGSGEGGLAIAGGDGDDVLSGGGSFSGGVGDDRLAGSGLTGGDGADVLTGTDADDRLVGGAGPDTLVGGGGDDGLTGDGEGAALAPDVLDGGDGYDGVDYAGHVAAVRIDLVAQTGGADGEGDRLGGIEYASGGAGDDVLLGDAGDNSLSGGSGRDRVHGRDGDDDLHGQIVSGGRGNDRLTGARSDDVLTGGPGDDVLLGFGGADRYAGGRGADRVALHGSLAAALACGPGRDDTWSPGDTLLPRDCETVSGVPIRPRAGRGGRLTFTLPRARHLRRGRVELRLLGAERRFAVGRFAGGRATERVRLIVPRRIRRLRREPLAVEVRIRARDPRYYCYRRLCWVTDLPR